MRDISRVLLDQSISWTIGLVWGWMLHKSQPSVQVHEPLLWTLLSHCCCHWWMNSWWPCWRVFMTYYHATGFRPLLYASFYTSPIYDTILYSWSISLNVFLLLNYLFLPFYGFPALVDRCQLNPIASRVLATNTSTCFIIHPLHSLLDMFSNLFGAF